MRECGVQCRITDDYAQGVGVVGDGLQLGHRGLRRAAAVVERERARLGELAAEAQVGGEVEDVAGDVAL